MAPGVQNHQVSLKQQHENLRFTKGEENSVSQESAEENPSADAVLEVPILNKKSLNDSLSIRF